MALVFWNITFHGRNNEEALYNQIVRSLKQLFLINFNSKLKEVEIPVLEMLSGSELTLHNLTII